MLHWTQLLAFHAIKKLVRHWSRLVEGEFSFELCQPIEDLVELVRDSLQISSEP